MEDDQTVITLLSEKEQLRQENEQLKAVLMIVKENVDLRTRMQSFYCSDSYHEAPTVFAPLRGKQSSLWKTSLDEQQFRKDLEQSRLPHDFKTSSPTYNKCLIPTPLFTDSCDEAQTSDTPDAQPTGKHRILGEIAFQLDRRILSHVFRGHRRLYGFTMQNIPDKIVEVSTHPLTGKVDEGYQVNLTRRYNELMEQLDQLGYKKTLHPPFTEFIINTYGILREKPEELANQPANYNNPDTLKTIITAAAPQQLQENLLLLLRCLCSLAEKDRKPLIYW